MQFGDIDLGRIGSGIYAIYDMSLIEYDYSKNTISQLAWLQTGISQRPMR